jgi:hypothetical protein
MMGGDVVQRVLYRSYISKSYDGKMGRDCSGVRTRQPSSLIDYVASFWFISSLLEV